MTFHFFRIVHCFLLHRDFAPHLPSNLLFVGLRMQMTLITNHLTGCSAAEASVGAGCAFKETATYGIAFRDIGFEIAWQRAGPPFCFEVKSRNKHENF